LYLFIRVLRDTKKVGELVKMRVVSAELMLVAVRHNSDKIIQVVKELPT
jgi:hypothetical protein